MYLMPAGRSVRNRKLAGLGRAPFRMRPDLAGPMLFRNRVVLAGPRGLGSLGQSTCTIDAFTGNCLEDEVGMPTSPPGTYGPPAPPGSSYGPGGTTVPSTPAYQPTGPAAQILSNILTGGTPSQSPLDYVSPQAAIAAGLNSQVVYAAWAQALAQYPTTQAALAAGIPSGVVNQLWTASRAYVGTSASSTLLGIPMPYLFLGGLGIFALVALRAGLPSGSKGRR